MRLIILFLIVAMMFFASCVGFVEHKRVRFLKSFSPDVIHYKLYVSEAPKKVTNRSKNFIIKGGLNTGKFDDITSRMSIDLTELIGKGSYYIGVSSVSVDKEESKIIMLDRVVVVE